MKKLACRTYRDPLFQQNYEGVDGGTSLSDDGLSSSAIVALQLMVDVSRDSSRSEVVR